MFDDIRVEPATFRAFKAGQAIQLEPKALKLLLFLIENRDRLIEKEEILNTIWSGTYVTENALTREIAKLRKLLGDDPKAPKYIQTVHTRGYRFIAELNEASSEQNAGTTAAQHTEVLPASESSSAPAPSIKATVNASQTTTVKRADFRRAVTAVITVGIALGVVSAIVAWKRRSPIVSPSTSAGNSVAVLPFKTSVPDEEYLGVEIADTLVNRLSNSTKLSVQPITAALHYGRMKQDPRAIGSLMKVDYVLYGEIDRPGQHMSTHLLRVQDGVALIDESYDEKFDDIFRLEDSLCGKVLHSLLVTLDHEEGQGVQKRYTENQQAYESFLKAHFFMSQNTRQDTDHSIELFRRAIDLDPKYAMAYAGLSDCYMRLRIYGDPPADFLPQSRAAVMKALELDETVAYAHSMLGRIAFQYDWDFSRAEREYARARELDPKLTHAWFGFLFLIMNRPGEAEAEQYKFEQFLPFSQSTSLAQHFYFTGQYDRAVDNLNTKIAAGSNIAAMHEWLGLAYEQQGRTQQAIEEFQKAISVSNGLDGLGALGHLYATSGKPDEARKILQKIDEVGKRLYVSPYQKAVIYAALGKTDEALAEMGKAYEQRSLPPTSVRFDPRLNDLRRDPRFHDLLKRTGMPQ
ncbi:MAG TPA: winged helix-turn-helix domain-containing protein [Pyrinomonadaceae bacterium]|nr:winged helix-turn-helix domain-containing protein [Pyrinomonadaceae bacterium]